MISAQKKSFNFHYILFIILFFLSSEVFSDNLVVFTNGIEGKTTAKRSFKSKNNSKSVKVKYRFKTAEVPGGYFGSQFNDTYNISIRSSSGGITTDSNSMNSLGLGAFDQSGLTAWKELPLSITGGDNITINASVSNVGDGQLDSSLIIDFVDEGTMEITQATLYDIDNSLLNYLSSDSHSYFNGNTRIHASLTITGSSDDGLGSLVLEVIQNGVVVATGSLSNTASNTLIRSFGQSESLSISTPIHTFNISSNNNIDVSENGNVRFRLRANSTNGNEATLDIQRSAKILTRYTGSNRYGQRDSNVGGDDWVKPSVKDVVNSFSSNTYGDFSNMNGGSFPPHSGHKTGNQIDGWFSGYNSLNASTASTIVNQLNSNNGSKISRVFVTFSQRETDTFWNEIKNLTLNDGREAKNVIRPLGGHDTHFHWRVSD